MTGSLVPAKTPAALIKRLNEEIVRFLTRPDVKERFLSQKYEIVGSTPEEFGKAFKADMAAVDKVVKASGIKLE